MSGDKLSKSRDGGRIQAVVRRLAEQLPPAAPFRALRGVAGVDKNGTAREKPGTTEPTAPIYHLIESPKILLAKRFA
jgi:hypothetical protein